MKNKTFKDYKINESNSSAKFDFKLSSKIKFEINADLWDGNKNGNWNVSDDDGVILHGYMDNGNLAIEAASKKIHYFKDDLVKEVKKIIKKWQ